MQLFKLTHSRDMYNFHKNEGAKDIYLGHPDKGIYMFLASYRNISLLFQKDKIKLVDVLAIVLNKLGYKI